MGLYGAVGTFIDGGVLQCGGKFGDANFTDLCFRYDFTRDTWEDGPSLIRGRRRVKK